MPDLIKLVGIALVSALLVLAGLTLYLSTNLPDEEIPAVEIPAAGLKFAFGSGKAQGDTVLVTGFADGYALLSSGPVKLQAENLPLLQYSWLPHGKAAELAFFWRRQGNATEVKNVELTGTGTGLVSLRAEPDWRGDIVEIGFLVGGSAASSVSIGQLLLKPEDLRHRFKLMWQNWSSYELRSQQSINFLQGGAHNQLVPLPILLLVWMITTLLMVRLLSASANLESASSSMMPLAMTLFLVGWILLDVRWTTNSWQNARELTRASSGTEPEQRSGYDLDGEIFKYIHRVKEDVIQPAGNGRTNRILILGDESAIDYYLFRAKYHLLPDSAHVAGRLDADLRPETVDYVIYFGQSENFARVPGLNAEWKRALKHIDSSKWGTIFRVQP